ncbi:hypothetical protein G6F24_016845 [Rhizopus arrhizus]|nr:hypothetical protein G6F24_016845 [Rhizopus arrhizus]
MTSVKHHDDLAGEVGQLARLAVGVGQLHAAAQLGAADVAAFERGRAFTASGKSGGEGGSSAEAQGQPAAGGKHGHQQPPGGQRSRPTQWSTSRAPNSSAR